MSMAMGAGGSGGDDQEPRTDRQAMETEKRTSAGRRKLEMKVIGDDNRRHVAFSKRKAGIINKAAELSVLTGSEVVVIVFSKYGKTYTFSTPGGPAVLSAVRNGVVPVLRRLWRRGERAATARGVGEADGGAEEAGKRRQVLVGPAGDGGGGRGGVSGGAEGSEAYGCREGCGGGRIRRDV